MRVYLVIVAGLVVVGLGVAGNLAAPAEDVTTSPLPPVGTPAAAATPRATLATTPVPTLAPMVAAATATELAPTGVLVADLGDPAIGNPVADMDGTIWAKREGAVLNVDPRTGRTRAWTLADDPAFAMGFLAPARQHGVWLVTEEAIRLYDGERFRAVIDTPAPVTFMAEAADGTLWAQAGRYGLVRWVDGTWTSDPPGRPTRGAARIVVDGGGRVWTVNHDVEDASVGGSAGRSISVWDGSRWTTFTADDLPRLRTSEWPGTSLIACSDGGVCLDLKTQVARFLEGGWTTVEKLGARINASLSAAGDDGRLWFIAEDCGPSCGVRIQVYDWSTVTTYDEGDGLPGADAVSSPGAIVLPGPDYVVAATDAGLYRLAGGSWQPLGSRTAAGAHAPELARLGEVAALGASSRDEVWLTTRSAGWGGPAPGGGGLFRYDGSAWHREQQPVEAIAGQATWGPGGALWVATSSGPLVRRNGAWTDLGETVAAVVPKPGELDDGCGGVVFAGNGRVAYYAGPRSANRLVTLRLVKGTWKASLHRAMLEELACSDTFVVTADGSIWRLQRGWLLSRWADGQWQAVSLVDPSAIVADGEGSLVVAVNAWDTVTKTQRTDLLQPAAGEWTWRGGAEGMEVRALALHPDGSLIAVGDGVAVLRGQRWQPLWHGLRLSAVSVAPDGAVWVAGSNVYRLPPVLR